MNIALFWLSLLALYSGVVLLGERLRLIPIVCQLLVASLFLPALLLLWIEPQWQLSAADLLAPTWLNTLYSLVFALLLGAILGDVVDLELSPQSLKIALPSFFLPFACGLACALWLLPPLPWLGQIGVGLLFAITAIPVLYLYLQSVGYSPAATKRLLHAAILMDLMCWGLFALAQGSGDPLQLLWPLLGAALPLLFKALRLHHWTIYSLPFFALMLLFQQLKLNALIFGIGYLLCLAWLGQPFRLPLPAKYWQRLMNYFGIPLILSYGVLKVDFHGAWQGYSWLHFGALLALPVLSKLAGNWLGLSWADRNATATVKWRESLLLNIRGLTEIVFLNFLIQLRLIDSPVYFSLLLMSLVSTLLPALLGLRQSESEEQELTVRNTRGVT